MVSLCSFDGFGKIYSWRCCGVIADVWRSASRGVWSGEVVLPGWLEKALEKTYYKMGVWRRREDVLSLQLGRGEDVGQGDDALSWGHGHVLALGRREDVLSAGRLEQVVGPWSKSFFETFGAA